MPKSEVARSKHCNITQEACSGSEMFALHKRPQEPMKVAPTSQCSGACGVMQCNQLD